MFPKRAIVLSLAVLALPILALGAGCSRKAAPPRDSTAPASADGYAASPTVQTVRADQAGIVLAGAAAPRAKVRLATPQGQASFALADATGRWSLALPPASDARIFGLSQAVGRRQVQAEGYLLVGPRGQAALLRAGAGAERLDPAPGPRIGAFDFDRDGGAVVSGTAPPKAWLSLRLDGRQSAELRADPSGRYAFALTRMTAGAHTLDVVGDGFEDSARIEVTAAQPLVAGPMHSQFTQGGLRVDWMTPGGGEQTTILLD